MKKFILAIVLLFAVNNDLFPQNSPWQWANPLPQGNILNGIWEINPDTLIAIGDVGTIIRSTDAGSTWEVDQNSAGITEQLFATQFISPTTGWAVGEFGRILKSTDGGLTWFVQNIQTISDLYALYFISPTVGWVTGTNGVIFQTIDGGNSWIADTTNSNAIFFTIHFQSPTVGWALGTDGALLKTTNGGGKWNTIPSGTAQTLYSIQFVSPTVGFISGSFGTMLKTTDGGGTWFALTAGTEMSLYTLQFVNTQTGWAAGSSGAMIKTTNGGTSWTTSDIPTQNDIFSVTFSNSSVGWAVGDFGTIIKTFDGTNWDAISTGPYNTIYGLRFATTSEGFAVGDAGTILITNDGGRSWTPENSGTYQALYGVYFINASTGWVVGDSANILKTTNNGATWINQPTNLDMTLYDIAFPTATNGVAVGDFGTVLNSSNGGLTWNSMPTFATASLVRVRFATSLIGWAIGYNGTILKTVNGGKNWLTQASGTSSTLNAIEVIDAQTAFIAGDLGILLATTDGGSTWNPRNSNTTGSIYGISFYSNLIGMAAADDGSIVGTYDGGKTWLNQNVITTRAFFDLQIVHGSRGGIVYASGEAGTILTSTISPLPMRVWTGSFDSLWYNPANWNPVGIPEKIDSIYIPVTSRSPAIRSVDQQIDIGAMSIAPGARLTISASLASLVVHNNITVLGSLILEPDSRTTLFIGGSLLTQFSGTFSPGNSTVVFMGSGQIKGTFYNVFLNATSSMQSIGNIKINNYINVASNLYLRSSDTLTIANSSPVALEGTGLITPGTIRRAILPGSKDQYRFESTVTYLNFYQQGIPPNTVDMTVFPATLPPGVPDSLFVRRYYSINATGGNNFLAYMSLRYDTSETSLFVNDLSLFMDSSGVLTNVGSTDFLDSDLVAVSLDSIRNFSQWLIGRYDYYPRNPYAFAESLFTLDHAGKSDTLPFGALDGATDGIDTSFGEMALGPKPGVGNYDLRWNLPPTNGTKIDIRGLLTLASPQRTYSFTFQPASGSSPVFIRWDSTALAAGTFFLQDQSTHGGQFSVNMKSLGSLTFPVPSPTTVEIVHKLPVYYSVAAGWNLLSLPLKPTNDGRRLTTFPTAISEAFGYAGSYFVADTLRKGVGYWIKFAISQTIGFEGIPRTLDTIPIADGWNLIGAGSKQIPVATVLAAGGTSIKSNYFEYVGGYQISDTLRPSKGYWVKVAGAGSLILNSTSIPPAKNAVSPLAALQRLNNLTFTDNAHGRQALYFGAGPSSSISDEQFVLPPAPPAGFFDVRFTTGTMVDFFTAGRPNGEIRIQTGSYPVSVHWKIAQHGVRSITFTDPRTGKILRQTASNEGTLLIEDPSETRIALSVEYSPALPTQFALLQNYPNPFNPTTTIDFQLPVDARATLTVYNILGQAVQTLIDHQDFSAGTHTAIFDGRGLSSGVYFYRLQARPKEGSDVTRVQKMMLIK